MASQGPNFPGAGSTATGGAPEDETPWVNPGNIVSDNGSEAQITHSTFDNGDISERLTANNFGFSIPGGATIDGVTVVIERRCFAGAARDFRVQLRNTTGVLIGDNKATVDAWGSFSLPQIYGGVSDDWNASLTPTIVNHANFGVVLSVEATANNTDIGVDRITVTIEYTEGSPTPIDGSGGLSFPFSTASVAVEKLSGSGGTTFPFAAAASGTETFPLSGGLSFPFSVSAAGTETLSASGGVAFPFSLDGAGSIEADESVTGVGALAFSFSAAGVADELLSGAAALSFDFGLAGLADELLSASGGVSFAFSAAAEGQHVETDDVTGSGDLSFGFNSAGVAALGLSGSGGVQFDFSVLLSGATGESLELSGGVTFTMSVQGVGQVPLEIGGDVLQLRRGKARPRYPWNRGAFPRR